MSAEPAGPGQPAGPPGATVPAGPARHGRLRVAAAARGVPLATILVTVAVVALTYLAGKLAYRIRDVLLMLMVAGFIALILNPLAQGLTHFSQRLPSYVQNAEHGRGWIGHLVHRFHLQAWVTRNAPKLRSLGLTLARPALTVGKGAASLLATLGTIFVLIVLFLLEGPKMRQGLLGLMQPGRGAYCTRVAAEISRSATGYALGNLFTSLIAGVVICSSCCHSWSGHRSVTGSAAFSAASWPPCFPSRSRVPFRSLPGNYGRPPHGRDRPTANR